MVKEKDVNSRELSREALRASVSSSVKWGQPCFSRVGLSAVLRSPCLLAQKGRLCTSPPTFAFSDVVLVARGTGGVFPPRVCVCKFNHSVMSNSATTWMVTCPWGFSRQEYSSLLPFPSPGDLPDAGTEPWVSYIVGRFFTI